MHNAQRYLFQRSSHTGMLFGLLVIFPLGCLHHTEYILRRCTLAVRSQISQGDTKLVLEMLDGRMVRFRRDVSLPTMLSLLCASCDWLSIPTPGPARVYTSMNAGRALPSQTC